MFSQGDAIVHPEYGAGIIQKVQSLEVGGKQREYLFIELVNGGTLLLPEDRTGEVGMHLAITSLDGLRKVLGGDPGELPEDYRARQAQMREHVYSGDLKRIASVVRDLAYLGRERKLAKQDQDLKSAAQHLIATEIAVHLNLDLDAASAQVEDLLNTAIGPAPDTI